MMIEPFEAAFKILREADRPDLDERGADSPKTLNHVAPGNGKVET